MKKSKEKPFILFGYQRDWEEHFELYHPDTKDFKGDSMYKSFEMPREFACDYSSSIVGCCNGVLCLVNDDHLDRFIFFWNPCVRKAIQLPPPIGSPDYQYIVHLGFGFDQVANDFKVVLIAYRDPRIIKPVFAQIPFKVEVYTVESGSWRSIEGASVTHMIGAGPYSAFRSYVQCFMNGVVHWAGYNGENLNATTWSVTFSLHEECFGEIKFPAVVEGSPATTRRLKLTTCRNMLALIAADGQSFCLWLMKEYGKADSWTEFFKFDNFDLDPKSIAFYIREEKEFLMVGSDYRNRKQVDHILSSIDCERAHKEDLRILRGSLEGFYLGTYEEGLALFNEGVSISPERIKDDENQETSKYRSKGKGSKMMKF